MTEDLTALRGVQAEADAALESERVDAVKGYRKALLSGQHQTEQQRAQALLAAAENEKEQRFQEQVTAAEALAAQGDYSLLGKLYGLTQDQIDRIQGTGKYAPVYYGGDDDGGSKNRVPAKGGPITPYYMSNLALSQKLMNDERLR
jgi:hypothetical protein